MKTKPIFAGGVLSILPEWYHCPMSARMRDPEKF
jgi:hypothetical protein